MNGSVRNLHCAERVVAAVVCLAYLKSQRVWLEPTSRAGRDTHTWLICLLGLQSATFCLSALPPLSVVGNFAFNCTDSAGNVRNTRLPCHCSKVLLEVLLTLRPRVH